MRVLIVLTSHDRLGDTAEKTGLWLEELASPYFRLRDAGVDLTLASPKGGRAPVDPKSLDPSARTEATQRFEDDAEAQKQLANTRPLSEIRSEAFDAVFYPGGHGPLWDLVSDPTSIALIEGFTAAEKPVAAVCHAPAALVNAKNSTGHPLLAGKRVTGFSNTEEAAVELTDMVPFLLQDRLEDLGAHYERAGDWQPHVVVDGLLITGQNPASSEAVADALLGLLRG